MKTYTCISDFLFAVALGAIISFTLVVIAPVSIIYNSLKTP